MMGGDGGGRRETARAAPGFRLLDGGRAPANGRRRRRNGVRELLGWVGLGCLSVFWPICLFSRGKKILPPLNFGQNSFFLLNNKTVRTDSLNS